MAKPKDRPIPSTTSASGRVRAGATGPGPQRSAQRNETRRSWVLWLSLAVLALLAFMSVRFLGQRHSDAAAVPQATPPPFLGAAYPSQGHQGHGTGDLKRYAHFKYSTDPPTSGFHREVFTQSFVEDKPIPEYVQVHLLEHGNVLLQYNCLCPAVVNTLSQIAKEFDTRLLPAGTLRATTNDVRNAEEQGLAVVVGPRPGMRAPIALTAWTRLGYMSTADQTKIVSFINAFLHNTDNLNR